jgi:molybdopterin synthase sulfur carrier subunit
LRVHIASPLLSYTRDQREVEGHGDTVRAVLADLEQRFPGIRFRMIDEQDAVRRHMRIFVNGEQTWDLDLRLQPTDELHILQALSGG